LAPGLDDSYHYLLGATYTIGPVVFGGVFGQAFQDNGVAVTRNAAGAITSLRQLEDRRHTIWGIGAAYNLAPGLILYGYYNNVNDKNVPGVAPSDGRYVAGAATGTTLASFNGGNTRTINVVAVGIRMAF
ncbi:MAG: porin, partial [Acetobacteraceae bacterium]